MYDMVQVWYMMIHDTFEELFFKTYIPYIESPKTHKTSDNLYNRKKQTSPNIHIYIHIILSYIYIHGRIWYICIYIYHTYSYQEQQKQNIPHLSLPYFFHFFLSKKIHQKPRPAKVPAEHKATKGVNCFPSITNSKISGTRWYDRIPGDFP